MSDKMPKIGGRFGVRNGEWVWADGTRVWYKDDMKHRDDGPAIIAHDGSFEWWLEDELYDLESFMDKVGLSGEDRVMFKLKWCGK